MKKQKYSEKKQKYPEHVIFHSAMFDFDACNAISSHECTGLIPWSPDNESELEEYSEIVNYSPKDADIFNHKRKHANNL